MLQKSKRDSKTKQTRKVHQMASIAEAHKIQSCYISTRRSKISKHVKVRYWTKSQRRSIDVVIDAVGKLNVAEIGSENNNGHYNCAESFTCQPAIAKHSRKGKIFVAQFPFVVFQRGRQIGWNVCRLIVFPIVAMVAAGFEGDNGGMIQFAGRQS